MRKLALVLAFLLLGCSGSSSGDEDYIPPPWAPNTETSHKLKVSPHEWARTFGPIEMPSGVVVECVETGGNRSGGVWCREVGR